ncbi:MAG: porin [Blastocatellia bacterium]
MLSYKNSLPGWGSRLAIAAALAFAGPVSLAGAAPITGVSGTRITDEPVKPVKPVNKETGKPTEKSSADTKDTVRPASPEMARVVEALEERIRLLEEKLVRLTAEKAPVRAAAVPAAAVSSVDDVTEIKKEIAAIKDEVKKDQDSFSNFFRSVEMSGVVDGYYSYNNNKVDMFTQGRAFDVRHNAFSLQLAKIAFERKNSKDSPLGFRVDLGLGETVDRIISVSDSSRNDATKHVLQAYASYVAPIGSGLTLDFGKMYTPIGAEVVDTKDNFNYSRGWLFTYGPYYHAGLRAKYSVNDKVSVSGFLFNGWDNLFENNVGRNAGKTVGIQIGLTPTRKFALTQTYLAGPEAPLANVPDLSKVDNWRHAADTVATYFVNDKLTLMGNFIYGSDGDNNGVRGRWTGFAGYFKYAFNDRFAFSPRFEVLNDKNGLRTGVGQTVKDITLTQEVKLVNNLLTRFEFRRDFSNQQFFTNAAGAARGNQNTVIFGLSYFFTTRE